ncbi:MAG: hypothetical protein COB12_04715 [Flavobacterium sp.]|nr:MAG: hypothetical protein COB12_04715 [Flavobacterium sp.]
MKKLFNKIVVIELNSNKITSLIADPRSMINKKFNLSLFKIKKQEFLFEKDNITNNVLNLDYFNKSIIPNLSNHFRYCISLRPVLIKFINTGFFSEVLNSEELLKIIEQRMKQYLTKGSTIYYEKLSYSQIAYYSFTSFLDTTSTNYSEETEKTWWYNEEVYDQKYFFKNKSLHININSYFTQITIFNGDNFTDTFNIPIGVKSFCDLLIKLDSIDTKIIKLELKKINKNLLKTLNKIDISTGDIKLCVGSGITPIVEGFNFEQTRMSMSSHIFSELLDKKIKRLPKIHKSSRNNEYARIMLNAYLRETVSFYILDSTFFHFNFPDVCLNYANYRIGLAHNLLYQIKDP